MHDQYILTPNQTLFRSSNQNNQQTAFDIGPTAQNANRLCCLLHKSVIESADSLKLKKYKIARPVLG